MAATYLEYYSILLLLCYTDTEFYSKVTTNNLHKNLFTFLLSPQLDVNFERKLNNVNFTDILESFRNKLNSNDSLDEQFKSMINKLNLIMQYPFEIHTESIFTTSEAIRYINIYHDYILIFDHIQSLEIHEDEKYIRLILGILFNQIVDQSKGTTINIYPNNDRYQSLVGALTVMNAANDKQVFSGNKIRPQAIPLLCTLDDFYNLFYPPASDSRVKGIRENILYCEYANILSEMLIIYKNVVEPSCQLDKCTRLTLSTNKSIDPNFSILVNTINGNIEYFIYVLNELSSLIFNYCQKHYRMNLVEKISFVYPMTNNDIKILLTNFIDRHIKPPPPPRKTTVEKFKGSLKKLMGGKSRKQTQKTEKMQKSPKKIQNKSKQTKQKAKSNK